MTLRQKLKEATLVAIVVKNEVFYAAAIPGYSGYFATTCGNIISYVSSYNGRRSRIDKSQPRVLKPQDAGHDYKKIIMTTREGKHIQMKVHRLVAMTFLEHAGLDRLGTSRIEVNHINADPSDNRLCNLEWVTRKENLDWAVLLRTVKTEKKDAA
jgi:hypothetical protein